MGRQSPVKKQEKRKRQKHNKKKWQLSCDSSSNLSDNSSLGSPSFPEDTCSSENNVMREEDCKLLGIDDVVFAYEEDDKNDFYGEKLTNQELIVYLRKCNKTLAERARFYHKKYEDIKYAHYEIQGQCDQKIKRIRDFYKNFIYYSNSRSALMLKAAQGK